MRRFLLFILLVLLSNAGFSQAYIPMPADSAIWRYRIYDEDYIVQVIDIIFFLNGKDTLANGNTYHQVFSRESRQVGSSGFNPPLVPIEATSGDMYYGAIRESAKQVFMLAGAGEQVIFDFTVSVGDSIPAYGTKDKVVAIDSVLLDDGLYHKRYRTNDTTYFTIEGVGSNRGLFPDFNDGSGNVVFICLTDSMLSYLPDTSLPCTYVYPVGYSASVANVNSQAADVDIYPVPAVGLLHIVPTAQSPLSAVIVNDIGQVLWSGAVAGPKNISVKGWASGVYYIHITGSGMGSIVKQLIVQ